MRLVITGASGFIGQQIVPYLQGAGVDLGLIGRDEKTLRDAFNAPHAIANYNELEAALVGADAIHSPCYHEQLTKRWS